MINEREIEREREREREILTLYTDYLQSMVLLLSKGVGVMRR